MKESSLTKQIIAAANHCGATVYRNNIGAYKTNKGSYVRYGVGGNGGSDLIGWTRHGLFLAIEIKVPGWKPRNRADEERYYKQLCFIESVREARGIAGVVSSYEDVVRLLKPKTDVVN